MVTLSEAHLGRRKNVRRRRRMRRRGRKRRRGGGGGGAGRAMLCKHHTPSLWADVFTTVPVPVSLLIRNSRVHTVARKQRWWPLVGGAWWVEPGGWSLVGGAWWVEPSSIEPHWKNQRPRWPVGSGVVSFPLFSVLDVVVTRVLQKLPLQPHES